MSPKKKRIKKKPAAKRSRRPRIPANTETEVLVQCKYRCCLCYAIDADDSEKLGQIAHLDRDPSNNDISNLAFLCHDHHSRYDSTSLQSKGITTGFLRDSLQKLLEHQRLKGERSVTVTLTIDRDFHSFSEDDCAELLAEIGRIAKTKGPIRSLSVSPGSVKVDLELRGDDLVKLLDAFEQKRFSELGILDISYARGIQAPVRVFKDFDAQLGTPSKSEILAVVSNPDYVQPVLDAKDGSQLLVRDEFPMKGYATLAFVVGEGDGSWTVGRGVVIPRDTVSSWPVDKPRDLLCVFAERFGIPLPRFGNKRIVFDETIPIVYGSVAEALVRAFDFKRPESMLYRMLPRVSVTGARSIWLEVACKIGEEYAVALKSHGFKIDIERWREREQITFYW